MPRPRKYESNAERQAAYRLRRRQAAEPALPPFGGNTLYVPILAEQIVGRVLTWNKLQEEKEAQ
jgi:hypothetical protein